MLLRHDVGHVLLRDGAHVNGLPGARFAVRVVLQRPESKPGEIFQPGRELEQKPDARQIADALACGKFRRETQGTLTRQGNGVAPDKILPLIPPGCCKPESPNRPGGFFVFKGHPGEFGLKLVEPLSPVSAQGFAFLAGPEFDAVIVCGRTPYVQLRRGNQDLPALLFQ